MKIVNMTSDHVSRVAALEKLCFPDPWSEKSVASELANPLSCWLVALEETAVIGYVGSQTVLDETDMMNIAVDPAFRRRGVARALVLALCSALRERGSKRLTLEVRASNAPAHAMYAELGFVPIGRRPRYYLNPREDADILRLELTEEDIP